MEQLFTSTNPYDRIEALVADSPDDLVKMIKKIITPIRIIAIVGFGTKQVAYIAGDVRAEEVKRAKIKGVK